MGSPPLTNKEERTMRYLIIPKDSEPFLIKWFDPENHFIEGMIVFDRSLDVYYKDGKWNQLNQDHL